MKRLLLILVVITGVFARENPFVPAQDIKNETPPKENIPYFKEIRFTLPDSARIIKEIKVSYQNLDSSIDEKTIHIEKKFDWHKTFILTQNTEQDKLSTENKKQKTKIPETKKLSFKNFIKFEVNKEFFKIITKDTKIRDFLVTKPYKIVVDFKRDANFLTKTFNLNLTPFKTLVLGNHEGYYRVVIELDGHYIYKLKKDKDTYTITLE